MQGQQEHPHRKPQTSGRGASLIATKKRKHQLEKTVELQAAMHEVAQSTPLLHFCVYIIMQSGSLSLHQLRQPVPTLANSALTQVAAADNPAARAALAQQLAAWRRTAKKATKELYRVKRACSCGRAVNYPWTLR